jgi:hypothetical protein
MAFGANQGFMIAFYDTLKALIENVIELIFGLKVKIKKNIHDILVSSI